MTYNDDGIHKYREKINKEEERRNRIQKNSFDILDNLKRIDKALLEINDIIK